MSLQIARLARIRRRTADHILAAHGLSEATAHPLLILSERDEAIGQGVLAQEMGIEGPSLVRLVDLLEEEGLVVRREHPTDRRAKLLTLTAKGKTKAAKINQVLNKGREQLFQHISGNDIDVTLKVLRQLESSCDELLQRPVAKKKPAKSLLV